MEKNNKRADSNLITIYTVTAVLVILVIIVALMVGFHIDPRDWISSIFPSFNYTKQNPYQGFCIIQNTELGITSVSTSSVTQPVALANVHGSSECAGLKVSIQLFGNGASFLSEDVQFNSKGNIEYIFPKTLELKTGSSYKFTLRYEGKKLLMQKGNDFVPFEFSPEVKLGDCIIDWDSLQFVKGSDGKYYLTIYGNKGCVGKQIQVDIYLSTSYWDTKLQLSKTTSIGDITRINLPISLPDGEYWVDIIDKNDNSKLVNGKLLGNLVN